MAGAQQRDVVTANEAAAITGIPLKRVNRIVDAGLLQGKVRHRSGKRLIDTNALVALFVAHRTADVLTAEARRTLAGTLTRASERRVRLDEFVVIDLAPVKAQLKKGLGTLDRAVSMVAADAEVFGGTPCIRGTRIPVHDVADMRANGDAVDAVLTAYPRLKPEQVNLAAVYAEAYPRRGRPPGGAPWRGTKAKTKGSMRLEDLPVA